MFEEAHSIHRKGARPFSQPSRFLRLLGRLYGSLIVFIGSSEMCSVVTEATLKPCTERLGSKSRLFC